MRKLAIRTGRKTVLPFNYRIQKVTVGFLPERRLFGMFWRPFGPPVRTHNDACAAIRWRILAGPSC